MQQIKNYLSLVTFSHTVFAMPFALIGFFLAIYNGYPFSWRLLLLVILCMIFARNAAMAFNRFVDRSIDLKNPRTALREIPRGILRPRSVLFFTAINSILFITTAAFINSLTLALSPVALFIILGYSFTKKFTSLCHFILGLGLSLAPIGAYLAVASRFQIIPLLFSFIVFFWVSGFDIIYALQDESFDKTEKLHSLPVHIGRRHSLVFSAIAHLFSAALVISAGCILNASFYYWFGSLIFIGLLIYQHIFITHDNISHINRAFFTLNGIASIFFAFFTIADFLF